MAVSPCRLFPPTDELQGRRSLECATSHTAFAIPAFQLGVCNTADCDESGIDELLAIAAPRPSSPHSHVSEAAAQEAMDALVQAKRRRGYRDP